MSDLSPPQATLDTQLLTFRDRLGRQLEPATEALRAAGGSFSATRIRIDLNDRTLVHRVSSRHAEDRVLDVTRADLDAAGLETLVEAIRARMPDIAWPVTLHFEVHGAERHGSRWAHVSLAGIGAANHQMDRSGRHSPLMVARRHSFGEYEGGLDAIAEGLHLVARICPPTNREVRSWSSLSFIMGEFCHNENVHARSEAEFLLKMRLFNDGIPAIREILETGRFTPKHNEDRMRFTSIELPDLDLHPLGKMARSSEIFAAVAERLTAEDGTPAP
ncbi:hypothetical protein LAZ40_06790 [Cereibacter sphaeroides]|uniref:hypothetical protein n=1 Tax=Cereibacter sphaeroides TaxID=1063 RepID=UPI001F1D1DE2|nr:hypothetical protein [Cereibacter sphaeroides]MCE6958753.1 hypothetical protein [Cereibacter sphaeroides]MCE6973373.1 hypothetical protein [Cereibacter sphaeroides]